MNINKQYAQTKYNVEPRYNTPIRYITVHNSGTTASAENNCKYFSGGDRNASADFFINKDGSTFQFNGDIKTYCSWHCGDGRGVYGITNYNSIGIEVVSAYEDFTQAQKDALKELVSYLKKTYGCTEVVRHYDASHKDCPGAYCTSDEKDKKWADLKAYISNETTTYTTKKDSKFKKTAVLTCIARTKIVSDPVNKKCLGYLDKLNLVDTNGEIQGKYIKINHPVTGISWVLATKVNDSGVWKNRLRCQTTRDDVPLRVSPYKESKSLKKVKKGFVFEANGEEKNGFIKIKVKGIGICWIWKNRVERAKAIVTEEWKCKGTVVSTVNDLNVRKTPSMNGAILGKMYIGNRVEVNGETKGKFTKINHATLGIAWVATEYIKKG